MSFAGLALHNRFLTLMATGARVIIVLFCSALAITQSASAQSIEPGQGSPAKVEFPVPITMPRIIGMTTAQAEQAVRRQAENRVYGTQIARAVVRRNIESRTIARGRIVSQSPAQNGILPANAAGEYVFQIDLSSGWPTAPALKGKRVDSAEVRRMTRGMRVVPEFREDHDAARNIIIAQTPTPGRTLPANRFVNITVSSGWPTAPALEGKMTDSAEVRRLTRGIRIVSERREDPEAAPNIIVAQTPKPGQKLPANRSINAVVSSGWPIAPALEGKLADSAEIRRTTRGMNLIPERREDPVAAPNIIIAQAPTPGQKLSADRSINVVVSSGWPTAPALEGKMADSAEVQQLTRGMMLIQEHREDPAAAPNTIITQVPTPGQKLSANRSIDVVISSGWPTAPTLEGKLADSAEVQQLTRGMTLITEPQQHLDAAPDIIIAQTPAPGQKLPANRSINIVVSSGWPTTPNLLGKTAEEAKLAFPPIRLIEVGQQLSFIRDGEILSQSPMANEKLNSQKSVEIVVSADKPLPLLAAAAGVISALVIGGAWLGAQALASPKKISPEIDASDGLELRVFRDHGRQSVSELAGSEDDRQNEAPVELRVFTDLGTQTIDETNEEDDR